MILGSIKVLQDSLQMKPSQLQHYIRKCYKDGCDGTITVTKNVGQHLFIETNTMTFDNLEPLNIYITDIPEIIQIENNR